MTNEGAELVLSYNDSLIHKSDVELLNGPYWLNDTLIGFYLEYLEREVYVGWKEVCFIRPEVLQCVKLVCGEELDVFLEPLGYRDRRYAIMPLNDNEYAEYAGGSHWSLLVKSCPDGAYYHIDSLNQHNLSNAMKLSTKLDRYSSSCLPVHPLPASQQNNYYDCGVYVLCYIEAILKHLIKHNTMTGVDLTRSILVTQKRMEIFRLIHDLAQSSG